MIETNIIEFGENAFQANTYSQVSDDIQCVVPGRKRKKRKIVVVSDSGSLVEFEASYHGPRVMKSDIRLSFPAMFTNVMNSADFPLMFGFFDVFCGRPFEHTFRYPGPHCSKNFLRKGVAETAKFIGYTIFMLPDLVCRIQSAAVYSADDGKSSRIECRYSMEGTKIYSDDKRDLDVPAEGSVQDIYSAVERNMSQFTLLVNPFRFRSDGRFIFYLDEFKRIVHFDMETLVFHFA